MELLNITIIAILISGIYCAKHKGTSFTGEYLELDNTSNKMYLFSSNECSRIYLCKTYEDTGFIIPTNTFSNCYLGDKLLNESFKDTYDPDDCPVKGYADINLDNCYITGNNNTEIVYKGKGMYHRARYYDINSSNDFVLTEFGWCKFQTKVDSETNWMSRITDISLSINQIVIPGTHDSGTSGIYGRIAAPWARTQNLDIYEQLLNGIRYLDIRLKTNDSKEVYISHGNIDSFNRKTNDKYYLSDVFDECVMFLKSNDKEFIVLTLADEHFDKNYSWDDVPQYVAKISILNKSTTIKNKRTDTDFVLDNSKPYKDYFYVTSNVEINAKTKIYTTTFPSIKDVQGKIVIYTKKFWNYNNDNGIRQPYGTLIRFPMMDDCKSYPINYSYTYSNNPVHTANQYCYPTMDTDYNILFQDNTDLNAGGKIEIIKDTLSNKVNIKYDNEYNDSLYKEYSKDDEMTTKFYNGKNNNTLIINSMNVKGGPGSIESYADEINDEIRKYLDTVTLYNIWMLMDYPSSDIIRKIFKENINYKGVKRDIENNVIQIDDSTFYNDVDYFIVNDNSGCIQRKVNNQENQKESIKTNYKCINNRMNKWRIEENNNYYRIRSSYDAKCLNYSNDGLFVDNCNGNKFEQIIIKDSKLCSINNKCLDGKYTIKPTIIESPRYEHLSCSSLYVRTGYNCCDNPNTEVEYVDEIGNWGIENGKLCGIGYERCSWNAIGYPCCSSVNPKVIYSDENGDWGLEDDQWCGIGEVNINRRIRIKNKKTQECLITNLYSDNTIILLGDCNHSEWTYKNEQLSLDATGKCLYAMNSQNARMTDCDSGDNQINHHIHFKLVDNKYVCIKNNVDPNDYCLDGKTLNFETSKSEYSEWIIENIDNNKIINSIDDIVNNNPSLRPEQKTIRRPTTTTTDTQVSTPTPTCSSKFSELGYPCYSDSNTAVVSTDDTGSWGVENGQWCGISDDITTTTTAAKQATSTSISKPTVKPGYVVYWFYHAFTNKCLYAPQELNGKITVKPCDDSEHSKWMALSSRKGYFYSMAHPNYCLRVADIEAGSLELGKWDEQAKLEHYEIGVNGFFRLIGNNDKCIGLLDSQDMYNNEIELNLNSCTQSAQEMFYNWNHNPTSVAVCFSEVLGYPCCEDPNTKVTTTDEYGQWGIENNRWCGILGSEKNIATLTPTIPTETYFLYNSASNTCVRSSGILESPITLDNCDYSAYSLWEIPYNHNGHFHLKYDTTHCIMLSNDDSLVLGTCGDDNTEFYREGNFIKSPLYADKCVGLIDSQTLGLIECNDFDTNQIFYFNLWSEANTTK